MEPSVILPFWCIAKGASTYCLCYQKCPEFILLRTFVYLKEREGEPLWCMQCQGSNFRTLYLKGPTFHLLCHLLGLQSSERKERGRENQSITLTHAMLGVKLRTLSLRVQWFIHLPSCQIYFSLLKKKRTYLSSWYSILEEKKDNWNVSHSLCELRLKKKWMS